MAVVALDRELHRVDAAEVLLAARMEERAGLAERLLVEERRELAHERADEIDALDLELVRRLVQVPQQKTTMDKLRVFKGFSPAELTPQPPNVSEPRTGLSMGQHCELMAQEWKISRLDQDRFAYDSHMKAAEAYRSGYMDDLIVPCAGVFRDNNLRDDMSLDKLATLKTAFDKSERGTLTAANSTPLMRSPA